MFQNQTVSENVQSVVISFIIFFCIKQRYVTLLELVSCFIDTFMFASTFTSLHSLFFFVK